MTAAGKYDTASSFNTGQVGKLLIMQILGITSRAGGVDPRSINMGPHSDQPMMATPQAPVHARPQHGAQGYNAFPSFQDIAAGLAGAGESLL